MRRGALAFAAAVALAACGGQTAPRPMAKAIAACPAAVAGQGTMGACSPKQKLGLKAIPKGITGPAYPDLSNNDPVFNLAPVKAHGHPAFVGKVNQGTGFIDSTYGAMVASAKKNGMAAGGYDFVQNYTAAEAYVFVNRLKATGTCSGPGVLPPTLDIEFGAFSYAGALNMLQIVRRNCGPVVQIYTGAWYWQPHAGCRWPAGTIGWVSGYPNAPRICGMDAALYKVHQYTDRGFNGVLSGDMNVFLGSLDQFKAFAGLNQCDQACKAKKLAALVQRRSVLRYLLLHRGCRMRAAKHQPLGPKCKAWFVHGTQTNAAIVALGGK